jgi:hypothetical protein
MKPHFVKVLFCGISFFLGLVTYKVFSSFSQIVFDPTFSFGTIIGAATTLLVGGLLATYLQRQSASDRKESELLVRHLDFILDELVIFEDFKGGGVLTEITASLHRLSRKRQSIESLLIELKYPEETIKAVQFGDKVIEIRKLATKTPIKQLEELANSKKCNSVVRDGIIEFAEEKRALLENKLDELKTQVIRAQLKINRI